MIRKGASKRTEMDSGIAGAVKIIGQVGPDIPQIARRLDKHRETIRYWYKKLLRRGFVVQASIDYDQLGLTKVFVVAGLSTAYEKYNDSIMTAISKLPYLQRLVRTVPEGCYIIIGSVPHEHLSGWIRSIRRLNLSGLFSVLDFVTVRRVRDVPMESDTYNFESDTWDFEWSLQHRLYPYTIAGPPPQRLSFDRTDLEIVKRFQTDASMSMIEVQRELGANYKTVAYHLHAHVIGRRLINGYRVNWIAPRHKESEERTTTRSRRYQLVDIVVRDVSASELSRLIGMTNAIPFLLSEGWGGGYFAQFAFPLESFTEATKFLARLIAPVKERTRWFLVDQDGSYDFTVYPELYDQAAARWKFDENMVNQSEHLLTKIREGTVEGPEVVGSPGHGNIEHSRRRAR